MKYRVIENSEKNWKFSRFFRTKKEAVAFQVSMAEPFSARSEANGSIVKKRPSHQRLGRCWLNE